MKILVVGAGIGGLGVAIALVRRGFKVEILEKAENLEEVGAGIQLSPNAMHVLNAYGLSNLIEQAGYQPESGVLRDYKSGKILTETPFGRTVEKCYGQKYLHIHRADLVEILRLEALNLGVALNLNAELKSFQQDNAAVSLELTDGRIFEGDLLVGADGLKSTVQAQMFGQTKPRFTGQVAWRATVPVDRLPASCVAPKATVWRGRGKHLVTYLLRSGTLANVVAVEERTDMSQESWRQTGDPNQLRTAFKGWHEDVETLLAAVEETHLWALYDREPLQNWTKGRVTLLGDACHPMLPFMAQGGAMALEDGYFLAANLANNPNLNSALERYEVVRKLRTSMLQRKSSANAGLFHMHGGIQMPINALKLLAGRHFPSLALKTLDGVYGTNVTN